MAFNTVPTVAPLDAWTSSQHNTYIKDNLTALWSYTTTGDIAYATASNTLGRLGIAGSGAIQYSTGSAPAWLARDTGGILYSAVSAPAWVTGTKYSFLQSNGAGAPVFSTAEFLHRRQGGDATNWGTAGTTTYTESVCATQRGSVSVSLSAGNGSVTVTYPVAFSQRPIIDHPSINASGSGRFLFRWHDDGLTGVTFDIHDLDSNTASYTIHWAAHGVIA